MKIHGKDYTEVKDRIPLLLNSNPDACITTEVYWHNDDFSAVVFKATVRVGEIGVDGAYRTFTGFAYEERLMEERQVNTTSWVENCETSAIGRALANMNIGVNGTRPSAEEMQKVERMERGPAKFSENFEALKKSLADADGAEGAKNWQDAYKEQIGALKANEKNILRKLYKEKIGG